MARAQHLLNEGKWKAEWFGAEDRGAGSQDGAASFLRSPATQQPKRMWQDVPRKSQDLHKNPSAPETEEQGWEKRRRDGRAREVEEVGEGAEGRRREQEAVLKDAFAAVADVSGHINKEQLWEALNRAGLTPSYTHLDMIWRKMDLANEGRVSLSQFSAVCAPVLVANAYPNDALTSSKLTEMVDLNMVYGGQGVRGFEDPSLPVSDLLALQRRYTFLQTKMMDISKVNEQMAEKLTELEVTNHSLRLEIEAIRPYQEKNQELQGELEDMRQRNQEMEAQLLNLSQENSVMRGMVERLGGDVGSLAPRKSAFSRDQERVLAELQAQVRELCMDDERYLRLEERVEHLTRENADLIDKWRASESLLQSILQVNQYLVSRQDKYVEALEKAKQTLTSLQHEKQRYEWRISNSSSRYEEMIGLISQVSVILETIDPSTMNPQRPPTQPSKEVEQGGSRVVKGSEGGVELGEWGEPIQWHSGEVVASEEDDLLPSLSPAERSVRSWLRLAYGSLNINTKLTLEACKKRAEAQELCQGYLTALRIAERNVDNLASSNSSMLRQLLSTVAAHSRAPEGQALNPSRPSVRDEYNASREQAEMYNKLMEPKVGPGSKTEKMPQWLFKENGQTEMNKELKGVLRMSGRETRPELASASQESIAQWLQQFRVRMKQASVRFLAAQDSSVLGAELYTKVAFDKLIRRAGAITQDMMREASMLRSEENQHNELAHQLSLLLEDTVETTSRMNTLAAVVHEIMLSRITRLQNSSGAETGGSMAWLKSPFAGQEGFGDKDEGLLNLASLSGVFGELQAGIGGPQEGFKDGAEAERMKQLLADIDKAIAEKKIGIDHRSNGFTNSRNGGNQMLRTQRQIHHNTLFGMMTSRLADATSGTAPE